MKKLHYLCGHSLWSLICVLFVVSMQNITAQKLEEPEAKPPVTVSRRLAVEEKQRVEISYPGHGWVYIGEQTSQQGLKYEQRKLQENNSVFMFTAEKKGDYVLQFSYFDVFTNDFITDAVAVSVSGARSPRAKSTVKAPEYHHAAKQGAPVYSAQEAQPSMHQHATSTAESKTAASPQPQVGSSTENSSVRAARGSTEEAPPLPAENLSTEQRAAPQQELPAPSQEEKAAERTGGANEDTPPAQGTAALTPDQLLEKVRTSIAAADATAALTYLDTFFTTATKNLDEGWFLKGRAYELNGARRNIRNALEAYKTVTDTFPQSPFWQQADTRIRYITHFYVNIR